MSDVKCSSIAHLLGAHIDGQLDTANTLEVEDHLGQCETCRERAALDRALRGSLKKAVKTSAPADVRVRMLAAMAGQTKREIAAAKEAAEVPAFDKVENAPATQRSGPPRMLRHWRTMIPFASAAAMALAWGFAGQQPVAVADSNARLGAGFGNDELINRFVDVHSRPMHPETPDPKVVRSFEREVGVPVHVPLLEKNARFVGARLLAVQGGERAAMLQYEVVENGAVHRVSVFTYDPRRVQVRGADTLTPHTVGTSEVRTGQARGYSVAITQHGDVGYAVASDLDADANAQLVAAAELD